MFNKEICIKLWNDIITECDKQITRYEELAKRTKENLDEIKDTKCTKCEDNLKKQYDDMIITCKQNINNWKNQKKNAIKEQKNCNKITTQKRSKHDKEK